MTLCLTAVIVALLPFTGTALGALAVFFLKRNLSPAPKAMLNNFAAGIMTAASFFSLLLPAIELSQSGPAWLPVVTGFGAGAMLMLLFDEGLMRLKSRSRPRSRTSMLYLAVTLHNLPEGMAVGVALYALLTGRGLMTGAAALALSAGIALQNLPEGAIVSLPLAAEGLSRRRAFLLGVLSGAIEPLGTLLTLWLVALVTPLLPFILALAAGAMIYVVVRDLIPDATAASCPARSSMAFTLGFALMMLLDTAL